MSIALQYDTEKKILYFTIIDKLNLNEFADKLKEIINSGDYPPDAGILLDITSTIVPTSNTQFESELIEIHKLFGEMKKTKIAIITNDFTFGMGEKYEILSETRQQNVMIFDNFIEGEEWLA